MQAPCTGGSSVTMTMIASGGEGRRGQRLLGAHAPLPPEALSARRRRKGAARSAETERAGRCGRRQPRIRR